MCRAQIVFQPPQKKRKSHQSKISPPKLLQITRSAPARAACFYNATQGQCKSRILFFTQARWRLLLFSGRDYNHTTQNDSLSIARHLLLLQARGHLAALRRPRGKANEEVARGRNRLTAYLSTAQHAYCLSLQLNTPAAYPTLEAPTVYHSSTHIPPTHSSTCLLQSSQHLQAAVFSRTPPRVSRPTVPFHRTSWRNSMADLNKRVCVAPRVLHRTQ